MRAVVVPEWVATWIGYRAEDVVRDAYGEYCSACERPLPQVAFAWDAGTGVLVDGPVDGEIWPEMLVLCYNCAHAATMWLSSPDDRLALPHRDLTFHVGGSGHLSYGPPEEATERSTGDMSLGARIRAMPNTSRGAETIARFALNSQVAGLHPEAPREPVSDQATLDFWDPRLKLRTAAWDRATETAEVLRSTSEDVLGALIARVRTMIEYSGFWSVWATVLGTTLEDTSLVGALLSSDAPAFPGTSDSALGIT